MFRILARLTAAQKGSTTLVRSAFNRSRPSASYSGYEFDEFDDEGSSPRGYAHNAGGYRSRPGGFGGRRQEKPRGNDFTAGSRLRAVDWSRVKDQAEVVKEIYNEHQKVTGRKVAEIQEWIEKNAVTLKGERIPRPVFNFDEAGFPEPIVKLLLESYEDPTTIQSISWPVALSGRDMISIGRTGTGKTLGFALPGIVHITNQPPRTGDDGPIALVLLPTRELAQQVEQVVKTYSRQMGLYTTCLFGGASKSVQAEALNRGVDFCIATPGRILDFLEERTVDMRRCTYLVLDEADRMLDMGFEPQIRKIIGQIRPDRQTLMFSATWPKEVRGLARDFQTDPVFLNVGSMELSANNNIEQHVEVVEENKKLDRLVELLQRITSEKENKTLIFAQTKRKVDWLGYELARQGWPAVCIHGDKSQMERNRVMSDFREGRIPIMLATDVASRGIDVTDIRYVINFDFPNGSEDYVHRIGRTGRCDMKGTSYSFLSPDEDASKAADLINVLKETNQEVPDELAQLAVNRGNRPSPSADPTGAYRYKAHQRRGYKREKY